MTTLLTHYELYNATKNIVNKSYYHSVTEYNPYKWCICYDVSIKPNIEYGEKVNKISKKWKFSNKCINCFRTEKAENISEKLDDIPTKGQKL